MEYLLFAGMMVFLGYVWGWSVANPPPRKRNDGIGSMTARDFDNLKERERFKMKARDIYSDLTRKRGP